MFANPFSFIVNSLILLLKFVNITFFLWIQGGCISNGSSCSMMFLELDIKSSWKEQLEEKVAQHYLWIVWTVNYNQIAKFFETMVPWMGIIFSHKHFVGRLNSIYYQDTMAFKSSSLVPVSFLGWCTLDTSC